MQKTKEKFKYLLDQTEEFSPVILKRHTFTNDTINDLEQSLIDEIFLSCFDLRIVREIHQRLYSPVFAKNEYDDEVRLKSIDVVNPFVEGKYINLINFSIWVLYILHLHLKEILVFLPGTQLTKAQNRALYNFICRLNKQKADEYYAEYEQDFSEPINSLMQYLEKIFTDEQTASDALYEALKPEQPIEATQSQKKPMPDNFEFFVLLPNGKYAIKNHYEKLKGIPTMFANCLAKKYNGALQKSNTDILLLPIFEIDKSFIMKIKNQSNESKTKGYTAKDVPLFMELKTIIELNEQRSLTNGKQ